MQLPDNSYIIIIKKSTLKVVAIFAISLIAVQMGFTVFSAQVKSTTLAEVEVPYP